MTHHHRLAGDSAGSGAEARLLGLAVAEQRPRHAAGLGRQARQGKARLQVGTAMLSPHSAAGGPRATDSISPVPEEPGCLGGPITMTDLPSCSPGSSIAPMTITQRPAGPRGAATPPVESRHAGNAAAARPALQSRPPPPPRTPGKIVGLMSIASPSCSASFKSQSTGVPTASSSSPIASALLKSAQAL